MLLRESAARGQATWSSVSELAAGAAGDDPRRAELLGLIDRAAGLAGPTTTVAK